MKAEIKAARTFDASLKVSLDRFQAIAPDVASSTVTYAGEQEATVAGTRFVNFRDTGKPIAQLLDP